GDRTPNPSLANLIEILACGQYIYDKVKLSSKADDYLTLLIRNTNPPDSSKSDETVAGSSELIKFVEEHVRFGASPRVNFALEAVARVRAFFSGSNIIKPEHIKEVASEVISHRLRLMPGVEFSTSKESVFQKILELTEIPKWQ
ncbi:MAG: hypothetical protein AAB784_03200, partial [Patescibacteria group bacterium]